MRHAPPLASLSRLAWAGTLLALGAGCTPSHPQSTFEAAGPVAQMQLNLFVIIFWAAVFVFVTVEGALLYAIFRFRGRPGQGLPRQVQGHPRLEVAWTIAPALVLAVIAVPTITTLFQTAQTPPGEALQVKVIGHQWWWEFQYPELGIVTANELHIPVGRVVDVSLQSEDVIHSFWVPKLFGKTDMLPLRENRMWFAADRPGTYLGQCAELCGIAHALMKFRVIAQPQEEFQAWVKGQQASPAPPSGPAREGAEVFVKGACVACHTIEGTAAKGTLGPNLSHFGSRTTLAAGLLDHTPENLAKWLRDPGAVKPGALMPKLGLSEAQISALVAYLLSLQ